MLELWRQRGFEPWAVVWQITHACNLNCRHCGPKAGAPLAEELSNEEALRLCQDLAATGCHSVQLTGGEPLMRQDWPMIAKTLSDQGIYVDMVSNGQLFSHHVAQQALDSGLKGIVFSIDGLEKNHTYLRRKPGSWQKILENIRICQETGLPVSAITVLYQHNLGDLRELHQFLVDHGVRSWRLQLAMPAGRMADHKDLLVQPEEVLAIVPLVAELCTRPNSIVYAAHNIGYYAGYEGRLVRMAREEMSFWFGCTAGLAGALIEGDGKVKGCCWAPVEGNVRERSFYEIWNDPNSFAYNRQFKIEDLRGFCRTCEYAVVCRGGCSRHVFEGDYPYCYHRLLSEKKENKWSDTPSFKA